MIDVICFCGCSYSFAGDAGSCPDCGELVSIPTSGSSDHAAHDRTQPLLIDVAEDDLAA
jgi:hypothetical protein